MSEPRIPDEGRMDARLVVVGEAPGRSEYVRRRPFIGASGGQFEKWWRSAGLCQRREEAADAGIYLTNVYPYWPGAGSAAIKKIPKEIMEFWQEQLHERIAELEDPQMIVPTGANALAALMGPTFKSVLAWRGSMLTYTDRKGRKIKCIPTIHPAATFRTPIWSRRCIADWQRIARELQSREYAVPERKHNIAPTLDDIDAFIATARRRPGALLACDIETTKKAPVDERGILCVGFALDPHSSLVIPTTEHYWGKKRLANEVWPRIRVILNECGATPVFHNGLFDAFWFREHCGIELSDWIDTMGLNHCDFAADTQALDFICSLYLPHYVYWKEEGKKNATPVNVPDELLGAYERLLWYNGTDVCNTAEVAPILIDRVKKEGRWELFTKHYTELWGPLLDLMCNGMRVDQVKREAHRKMLLARCTKIKRRLTKINDGEPLHASKDFSNVRIQRFLYQKLDLKPIKNRQTKRPTANEVAIKKLMRRNPENATLQEAGQLILKHRDLYRKATQLGEGYIDPDGKMRSSYGPFAESGRQRSSSNPFGTGQNAQNQDRTLRYIYIPDEPGQVIMEVDQSQAEDRWTKALTGAPHLLELANALPGTVDAHSELAKRIFGTTPEEVITQLGKQKGKKKWKAYRYVAKRARHACFDSQTELLTQDGWRTVEELYTSPNVEIAQWDKDSSKITFGAPKAWHRYDYTGSMVRMRGQAVDALVTPNHRVVYKNGSQEHVVAEAADYAGMRFGRLPLGGDYSGSEEVSREIVQLVVATQADGWLSPSGAVQFHFVKPRKANRLRYILQAAGIEFSEGGHEGVCKWSGRTRWEYTFNVRTESARPFVSWFAGKKCFGPWLLKWNAGALDVFLAEVSKWDGSETVEDMHRRVEYCTSEPENARWVQTVARLRCRGSLVRQSGFTMADKPMWNASLNCRRYARHPDCTEQDYSGEVYCPTVDTGFVLTRRNGEIAVFGQSNYGMKAETFSDTLLKDGFYYDIKECQRFLDAVHEDTPELAEWHRANRIEVLNTRRMVNHFGRVLDFTYDRLNDDAFRRAHAFRPQSCVAETENTWALIPLARYLRENPGQGKIVAHIHDALLISCWPQYAYDIARLLFEHQERPLQVRSNITGKTNELRVWCEAKIGRAWGNEEWEDDEGNEVSIKNTTEFERLPSRDEFTDCAMEWARLGVEAAEEAAA